MEYRYYLVKSTFKFMNVKNQEQTEEAISTEWAGNDGQAMAMALAQLSTSRPFDKSTYTAKARPMTGKEQADYKKKQILPKF